MVKPSRSYKFKAHFNRVNMQRGNPNIWTVHAFGTCYQTPKVVIQVPVETTYKPDGPQPRALFVGYCKGLRAHKDRVVVY